MSTAQQTVTAANIRALYAEGRALYAEGRAGLSWANLRGANLSWANLRGANLRGADLRGADLSRADLSGADLSWANLSGANLSGANLRWANLSVANLRGADLSRADLSWANLRGANLSGSKNIDPVIAARIMRCPPEGEFIAYKKLKGGTICKLAIPADARRSSATGYKCRAEFADVIEGNGVSVHDGTTAYAPGQRVTCHEWDADRWNECGGGIHFYMSREEAEAQE